MKIVQVTYTTQPEFAEINMANIKTVMNDLQLLNHPGINYSACLGFGAQTWSTCVSRTNGSESTVT